MKGNGSNSIQKMQTEPELEVGEISQATADASNFPSQQALNNVTAVSTNTNRLQLQSSDGLGQVNGVNNVSSSAAISPKPRSSDDNVLSSLTSCEQTTDPAQEIIERYLLSQGRVLGSGDAPGYLSQGGFGSLQESSLLGMDSPLSGYLGNGLSQRVPRVYNPSASNPLGIAGIEGLGSIRVPNSSLRANAAMHQEALLREHLGFNSSFHPHSNFDAANSSFAESRLNDYLSLSQANLRPSNYDINSMALSRNHSIRGKNSQKESNDTKD
eukprot:CAMPEP_0194279530 /NCGR_PEP_ID=MMETSP0169-20130528/13981_1 /TAXON_ID=218684 /ORGANISM="Corethron pennatum, Strain L29A3" /LENGTH=269 /DNA_ID=CAMNT_0039023965 /DNA_START=854 /DNA_END=1663 /DNA_ORIENTATION=+